MHPVHEREGKSQNIPVGTRSPADVLSLLTTDEILQVFVSNTNAFVKGSSGIPAWEEKDELSVEKLKRFFAIVLY